MNIYSIELSTRDAEVLSFECATDQNLLDAAAQAHIVLPSQCAQGNCGACYAEVTHGDFTLGKHNPAALPKEAKKGSTLLCCTVAHSDLQIALPFNYDRILMGETPIRNAEITAIDSIGENTCYVWSFSCYLMRMAVVVSNLNPANSWNWKYWEKILKEPIHSPIPAIGMGT